MPRMSFVPIRDSHHSHPTEPVHFDLAADGSSVEFEVCGRALRFSAEDVLDLLECMKRRGARS